VYVRRLALANFRCYRSLELTLPGGTIVVTGDNAQGKSSLLEALHVLATTRSPHAQSDRELLNWAAAAEPLPFSRVSGEVVRAAGHDHLEVLNLRQTTDHGEERFTKQVRLNGVPRRALDVLGRLNVVLFTPRDLELVHGGPAERRRYLDILLCQIDGVYCRALAAYNRVLAQRNHLLRRLRDRGGERSELAFWDQRLVAEGAVVMGRRQAAVAGLSASAKTIHAELVGRATELLLTYRASLAPLADTTLSPELAAGVPAPDPVLAAATDQLAARFAGAVAQRRDEDIARGLTLVGPHRDDLGFHVDGVDMRAFGSRGQQRTVALALKLAEARLMWQVTGERPVLLLDDVLSELDAHRQAYLVGRIDAHQQTLITTTDPAHPALARLGAALVLELAGAQVVTARQLESGAETGSATIPSHGP